MNCNVILLTQFAVVYLPTNFLQLWLLEMVCIHESYIVYFEISVLNADRSWLRTGWGSSARLLPCSVDSLIYDVTDTVRNFSIH